MKQVIINVYDYEKMDFDLYNGRITQELVQTTKRDYVMGIPELDRLYSILRIHAVRLTFYDEIDAFKFELAFGQPIQHANDADLTVAGVWERLTGDEVDAVREHLASLA